MSVFADYYDGFVGADYDNIVSFIKSAIKKYKTDSELVCDLGCGTGSIAIELAKSGFDMIAIDSDESMLMCAQEKSNEAGTSSLLILNQDICEFELYGTVDVIYSTLDTLNYITDPKSLDKLFYLVRNYLNYDGLFIFDINTVYKFENVLDGYNCVYDGDGIFCTWESQYNKDTFECIHNLTFFEENESGLYSRTDEVQVQRYYSIKEIENLCDKYGFSILQKSDDYSDFAPDSQSQRITFITKTIKK